MFECSHSAPLPITAGMLWFTSNEDFIYGCATLSKNLALRYYDIAHLICRDWRLWVTDWKVAVIFGIESSLIVIFTLSAPELLVKLRLFPLPPQYTFLSSFLFLHCSKLFFFEFEKTLPRALGNSNVFRCFIDQWTVSQWTGKGCCCCLKMLTTHF